MKLFYTVLVLAGLVGLVMLYPGNTNVVGFMGGVLVLAKFANWAGVK